MDFSSTLLGTSVYLTDAATWGPLVWVGYVGTVLSAVSLLGALVPGLGEVSGWGAPPHALPNGGAPLTTLEPVDLACIGANRLFIALFTYHALGWAWASPLVVWTPPPPLDWPSCASKA